MRIPVIIDCDPGIDDFLALIVAAGADDLDILGVTTVAGNIPLHHTTNNALHILKLLGRGDIPVSEGAEKPLMRVLEDASFIHGESGLGPCEVPLEGREHLDPRRAPEFLYETLKASGKKVTLLALAPMTNLAELIQLYPESKAYIDKIIFMGGSIRSGNPTPVSTFNVLADPEAARLIFSSGIDIHMMPLDTTRKIYFDEQDLQVIRSMEGSLAAMVSDTLEYIGEQDNRHVNGKQRFRGILAHDLGAMVYAMHPEYFTSCRYYADVETLGELTTGFTLIDYEDILQKTEEEKNICYIHEVSRTSVIDVLIRSIKLIENKRSEMK